MRLHTKRIDLELVPREELLDLRVEIFEEKTLIKMALGKAARQHAEIDEEWYEQNVERLNLLNLDIMKIDNQLRKLKQLYHDDQSKLYAKFFEVTANMLPPDLFSQILEEVNT